MNNRFAWHLEEASNQSLQIESYIMDKSNVDLSIQASCLAGGSTV